MVAEAAKKFGSGEIAMTTRLTMEIQGVPFENIEPLRQYLKEQAGLETRRYRCQGAPGGLL